MTFAIHLLGRPFVTGTGGDDEGQPYRFRSRKSWALLAHLLLSERPASRSQLASLLLADTDDPLRALRWNLSEIRRVLPSGASLDGDPVVLQLPPGTSVDVDVVLHGTWREAVRLPNLGAELLDGMWVKGAPGFESWVLSVQRHVAAVSEAVLHEAALASASEGRLIDAIGFAVRAASMSPLDENHQALLIRLYRQSGDVVAAEQQLANCTAMMTREFQWAPGPAVRDAMREPVRDAATPGLASIEAIVEAGAAAVSAGAVEAGIHSLRTAVRLADTTDRPSLRVNARLVLAETLIHSVGGFDEEGLAILYEADGIALAAGEHAAVGRARSEIGYVDFLRARYERAEVWLTEAIDFADGNDSMLAKVQTYRGAVHSDLADYVEADELLCDAQRLARLAGDLRRESFGRSMLGRVCLLRGDLEAAEHHLVAAVEVAERDHWLAVLPWPQALLGETRLAAGDIDGANAVLQQAFARACQLGDPCWEGIAVRGLALTAEAAGDTERAFDLLADARRRCRRVADPYVWLDAYILDAQCTLGRQHQHPHLPAWIDTLRELASRTGMRELTVRALLHGAAQGRPGDGDAALLLAPAIDNPTLAALVCGTAQLGGG